MKLTNYLTSKLQSLNAPAAYALLEALGRGNDMVKLPNEHWTLVRDWVKSDDVNWLCCNQTAKVMFWGGPPPVQRYFQGTLALLLRDRVLHYLLTHNLKTLSKYIQTDQQLLLW